MDGYTALENLTFGIAFGIALAVIAKTYYSDYKAWKARRK